MGLYEIKQLEPNGLSVVDLFCGAGVGAYGIKKSGYDMLYGVDNDPDAVRNYNNNIGNHAVCKDIREVTSDEIPECDLMIATPVCKPFSVSGARRLTDDEKYGDLLAESIRLLRECKPRAFLFENVKGLVIAESYPIYVNLMETIESLGYRVYSTVVNCWDYGVPQIRERVILTAIRNDCDHIFIPPSTVPLTGRKSQRDAIYDLYDKPEFYIKNHNFTYMPLYKLYRVTHRQEPYWDKPGLTVLSKIDSNSCYPEPKITVAYVKGKGEIMIGDENPRRMSVRENLRMQTVGDDFYFDDKTSLREQYNRCSGIPSLIAYKWGIAISECLNGITPKLGNGVGTYVKKKKLF